MSWYLRTIFCLLLVSGLTACASTGKSAVPGAASSSDLRPDSPLRTAATLQPIQINAGGPADGVWQADQDSDGGSTILLWNAAINTSHVTNPAPQAVYQSQRYAGELTYTIPNLVPNATYTVRLHFVESWFTGPGERLFNVAINGSPVLTNFDIFAAAGGTNIAVVEAFTNRADATGTIAIRMVASVNNAAIAALELLPVTGATPTPTPTPTPISTPPPVSAKIMSGTVTSSLSQWNAWLGHNAQFAGVYNDSGASSWSSLDDIIWMISTYPANTPMVWSLATYPTSSNLAAVAAGAGDGYYATWASQILSSAAPAPDGNYYIRPNWETPAGWFSWGTQCSASPANCIAAFQHIAAVFHAASPRFKLVWDVFPVYGVSTDNSVYYPGDAYVDVVSQDLYLDTSGTNSVAGQWSYGLTRANGLNWLASFAAAHGKGIAMSEWGVNSNTAGPLVTDVENWLAAHNAVYQIYFDMGNTQLSNNQYPAAGAVAKQYF